MPFFRSNNSTTPLFAEYIDPDDENSTPSEVDRLASEIPSEPIKLHPYVHYVPASAITLIIVQLLLLVIYEAALFLPYPSPWILDDDAFPFLVILHVGLYFISFVVNRLLHRHFRRTRLHGHLNFYRKTRSLRRTPYVMISIANAFLLVVVTIWSEPSKTWSFTRMNILQLIYSLAFVVSLITQLVLLYVIHVFNSRRPIPDAKEQLASDFGSVHIMSDGVVVDVRAREADALEEVVERQADMIKYLQQQRDNLSKRIVRLSERLKTLEDAPIIPPILHQIRETELLEKVRRLESELNQLKNPMGA